MSKRLTESPITTRNARAGLAPGLYWRGIDPEVHLGYRKGKRGGVWLVRWRQGRGYKQQPLGIADDVVRVGTLDFDDATKRARAAVETARTEAKALADGPPLTVQLAVENYIAERDARETRRAGRSIRSDAGQRLTRYVLGLEARGKRKGISASTLATIKLHMLREADLLSWRSELPDALKATTKQRLINDLKAALNDAYAANRDRLEPTMPVIIKHGLKSAKDDAEASAPLARENQILSDATISLILKAARDVDADEGWEGDLFQLVVVLAGTGARFSQVARMRVGDYQRSANRLLVPVSRKGRGGKTGSIPVPVGKDVLDTLLPATVGRPVDAPLLERWRHKQEQGSVGDWRKSDRGPWQSASELVRPWQSIRDHAELPAVIPYALRHSSIVRGIRANLPIRLVAALHDTSVAMIERHYGRWIADGLEELAARAIVPLVPEDDDKKVIRVSLRT